MATASFTPRSLGSARLPSSRALGGFIWVEEGRLLGHSGAQEFAVRVWRGQQEEKKPAEVQTYVDTILTVNRVLCPLSMDCNHLIERVQTLGGLNLQKNAVEEALRRNQFEELFQRILPTFRWRPSLARTVRGLAAKVTEHLFKNTPIWKKMIQPNERLYFPAKEIVFPIEYLPNGDIWLFFSQMGSSELFALDLQYDRIYHWREYPIEMGEKLEQFRPLFEDRTGILHLKEFYVREITGFRKRRIYIAKYPVYDGKFDAKIKETDKPLIEKQLSEGLMHLERAGIVHCNIKPESISIRYVGSEMNQIEAVFNSFEAAYLQNELPREWPRGVRYMPPEEADSPAEHPCPFAIAIYQLGKCLATLYKGDLPETVKQMFTPDPGERYGLFKQRFRSPSCRYLVDDLSS